MNFVERATADTKITVMEQSIPYVLIDTDALQKMFTYTDECTDEVGWLGTATREGNEYQITDVFLFQQEVHATTTEITPEGLASFAEEIMQLENGMDVWNNLKMWGHSHVNMGITPSGQDDKQMNEFRDVGHDWFIRLICNKKGELAVDVYDYKAGIIFKNAPWERLMSAEEETVWQQIVMLKQQLARFATLGIEEKKPLIQAEMKEKVKKKTYATTYYNATAKTGASAYGRYVNGVWKSWTLLEPTLEEMKQYEEFIPTDIWNKAIEDYETKKNTTEEVAKSVNPSVIETTEDVHKFFNTKELGDLAYAFDLEDLREMLDTEYGYVNTFSRSDLEKIQSAAHDLEETSRYGMPGYLYY